MVMQIVLDDSLTDPTPPTPTGPGLAIHQMQVHKEPISAIPNSVTGRGDTEIEIYGMEGIPEVDMEWKKQQIKKKAQSMRCHSFSVYGSPQIILYKLYFSSLSFFFSPPPPPPSLHLREESSFLHLLMGVLALKNVVLSNF